jgi:hypothetical protein
MKNSDMPAMPMPDVGDVAFAEQCRPLRGLTKREMFAMAAMQGLCASSIEGSHNRPEILSVDAVAHADALLAALESAK